MMKNDYTYEVGDNETLKKQHPCGRNELENLREVEHNRLKLMCFGHQNIIAHNLV